jgi:phospholipase C
VTAAVATVAILVSGCDTGRQSVSDAPAKYPVISNPTNVFKSRPTRQAAAAGITKIKHIVIITQENRSFDTYFGTYRGADGILGRHICLPDGTGPCVRPYHAHADVTGGGPHTAGAAVADINGGKMNGFVNQAATALTNCTNVDTPVCTLGSAPQVMAYYTQHEIPNYWAYARHYVLQDHFFEATASWSFPSHLYEVSGWSAYCPTHIPATCQTSLGLFGRTTGQPYIFAWTDITYLLHAYGVSWRYYVQPGYQPDCSDGDIQCTPVVQNPGTPGIWNPLPEFDTVREDRQTGNIQSDPQYYQAARAGTLPAVSWIVPNQVASEHPLARVSDGQSRVTRLINAAMAGPDWKSTAIFLSWDDWGGYYDHVPPVQVDNAGYGLRVPGMIISPYAKHGYIDHQVLSSDAYLKFIEDRWLGGQDLNPRTDGRPDARPDVRESKRVLGNLMSDFNFRATPTRPLILPVRPSTDLLEPPGYPPASQPCTGLCSARKSQS